jgi:serine/threonine protein kinase
MNIERKVIGEGTYGCVLKPSVTCTTPPESNFSYDGYVSKVMINKEADKELAEFMIIKKYDSANEYHLGTPIKCKPKLNTKSRNEISKCRSFDLRKMNENDLEILVIKDGGPNLYDFCTKDLDSYLATNTQEQTDLFWVEVQHLLLGLKFFQDNKIVHNDLKPQNILFNMKTRSLKYIDFGLMGNADTIEKESRLNQYKLGRFHWSFPLDSGLMNKYDYESYAIPLNIPEKDFNTTLFCITGKLQPNEAIINYIQKFIKGFTYYKKNKLYDDFLKKATQSIDVYGVGFTLQFVLHSFRTKRVITEEFFKKASSLFLSMCDFNPKTRVIDMEKILNEYETILSKEGILSRLNNKFENHRLVVKVQIQKKRKKLIVEKSPVVSLSPKLQMIANLDPKPLNQTQLSVKTTKKNSYGSQNVHTRKIKECPEGKELNPSTNRCINKCPSNTRRNDKGRCVKK